MIRQIFSFHILLFYVLPWHVKHSHGETVSGCTINNNQRRTNNDKTSVTLSCANNGFILVRNLTFGVHKSSLLTSTAPTCAYQPGDCTTRTTFIGMECNGLTSCNLDLNPQYLHICSQYSDYMVLDYSCLQGPSLSVCDHGAITTSLIADNNNPSVPAHRLFLRSPNYPNEYENSLNCSCQITAKKSHWKFLDFYLEERDELDLCSRDRLTIAHRSYCGSTLDDQKQTSSLIVMNSSTQVTFKSNDVITRKGFWLMITSEQPVQVSCSNLMESTTTTTITTMTTTSSILTSTTLAYSTLATTGSTLAIESVLPNNQNTTDHKRRFAMSYVLLVTIIAVVVLVLLNLVLVTLCWRQRRAKDKIDMKSNGTNQPFFCSARSTSSSSSSVTYGETPVLTSLGAQKHSSTSSRYIFQPSHQHLDTTPSTSTTTATTGPYEDLHDSSTLQRSLPKQKSSNDHLLYTQQRHIPSVSLASPYTGYNRMIHFPPAPIRCHFSTPAQTFYPPQPCFDSQHIYETIQDGHCPYQRLAATLRRPAPAPQIPPACSCYYEHTEHNYPSRSAQPENSTMEVNPETLV